MVSDFNLPYYFYDLQGHVFTDLNEKDRFPGTAVPDKGTLVPSNAPGFGLEIKKEWFPPFFN